MKIRNGFVSNSSSSSFLIYGFPVYKDDDLYDDLYELGDFDKLWNYVHRYDDEDTIVVGKMLADVEGIEVVNVNFSDLDDKKKEVCDAIKKESGVDLSNIDFKFVMGEVYS